MKIKRGETIEH
ncbi:Protein of unknown function [Lactobacillus helveticus CIRM-BIA 103]|nr:Protein of unknown function [Lactobacillus helveticus CIRM-BIA 103]